MRRILVSAVLAVLMSVGSVPQVGAAAGYDTGWAGTFEHPRFFGLFLDMSGVHEGEPFSSAPYWCGHPQDNDVISCELQGDPLAGSAPASFSGPVTLEQPVITCIPHCGSGVVVTGYTLRATVLSGRSLACDGTGYDVTFAFDEEFATGSCTLG